MCVIRDTHRSGWVRALALLLAAIPALAAAAAETLTVTIDGVSGRLYLNVAAYLAINRFATAPAALSDLPADLLGLVKDTAMIGLTGTLPTGQKPEAMPFTEEQLRRLHAQAPEDIREALQPFGYYEPQVESSLERTDGGWAARYRIDPGPPIRVGEVDLQLTGEGATDPVLQALWAGFPLKTGDILVQPAYDEFKQQLQVLASERGYFDGGFPVHEIRVHTAERQAAIRLHYATGPRYRFGRIRLPETALAPEFLRRYLQFEPGDPYDALQLLRLQRDLIGSDYFSRVAVSAPVEQAQDRRVPVTAELAMQPRYRWLFGAGYGSDTGLRGQVAYLQRWVNPDGHRLQARAIGSAVRYTLGADYVIPGGDPATDAFILRGSLTRENSDVIQDLYAANLGFAWRKQFGLWQQTLGIDYTVESFRFTDREKAYLLIPGAVWERTDMDNPLNVRRGSRVRIDLRGAWEPLLSVVSFGRLQVDGWLVHSLGERHRLTARASGGAAVVSDFDLLPPSQRFFAGGEGSVRGYPLDKLAPRDAEGNYVGGKRLLTGSLEYEYRLLGDWGLALFTDSGDAFDERPDLRTGLGMGLRWYSPVGPVRFDLAHGLDREVADKPVYWYLSIGPPF